jgi:hypothetical protein
MLHRRDGARFPPDLMLGLKDKEFNLGLIRPESLVSHGLRVFRCLFGKTPSGLSCAFFFTEEWLLSGPLY